MEQSQGFPPAPFAPGRALPPQGLKAEERGGLGFEEVLLQPLAVTLLGAHLSTSE